MHVVHLAVGVDLVTSTLQELSDDRAVFDESSRERRLNVIYNQYIAWTRQTQVPDVAGKRLFTTGVLSNNRVVEVSQKVLSATACRYLIIWIAIFLKSVCRNVAGLPERFAQPVYLHAVILWAGLL